MAVKARNRRLHCEDLILYATDPILLCERWPWYPDYLKRIQVERQEIEKHGIRGRFTGRAGFSPSRILYTKSEIPSVIVNMLKRFEPDIMENNWKHDRLLMLRPEWDLRPGRI